MAEAKRVKEIMTSSACSHSSNSKGCNRATPGLASGGCAFEGAQIALFPFADAAHLVHSPATCLGASWETRATHTSFKGRDLTQMGFCSDLSENDVIFGGEKKLKKSISYIVENYSPKAVFVYETCVSALTGDDIKTLCKEASSEHNIPIVPVMAPGFVGSKNLGSKLAGFDVLEHLIGTKEPTYTTPYDINLIGEYNVTGDMDRYKDLLDELGIRVLSTFSGDGRIEKIQCAHRAKLNVLVCAKSLEGMAKRMEEKYDIPYISTSFYGARETSRAIVEIAKALGDKELIKKAEELTKKEERKLEESLQKYRDFFAGKKAVLNTGGNKAWSVASALQDMGIEVVATSVKKCTEADKAKCAEVLGSDGILMDNPGAQQYKAIDDKGAHLLLAGGRSLYGAIKKKVAFIDVNQEKEVSYGAYVGLLNFAEDVKHALSNPVFYTVSKEAPWEQV
ncbi:MAG: nitrogenase iron-molybdenum cofactor biosynthesis protein NifE [Campylobacterales bacterium]